MTSAPTPEPLTKAKARHWDALDGIRAWAVVIMMCYHFGRAQPKSGFLSIDMFFVLSGFLITSLLVGEREKRGSISYRNFYARRALRLLPAIFAVMIFVAIVSVALGNRVDSHATLTSLPSTLFYFANWVQAFGYEGQLGMLAHTWSLSLEEQFYLIWPLLLTGLLIVIKNRRNLAVLLALAAMADMAYRALLIHEGYSWIRVYYATDTHCDGLLLGCAIGVWLSSRTAPLGGKAAMASKVLATVGVVSLSVAMFTFNPYYPHSYAVGIPIAVFSVGAIIFNLVTVPVGWIRAVLGCKPMVWIGKRSYGLYLWHWPLYVIIGSYWSAHPNRRDVTEFVATFIVAALSYKFIEEPFLRRKVRFQRTESMPVGLVAQEPG